MRALSTIGQDVERSIEKALYDVLVFNGWIPNKVTFASNPAGYKTAKDSIKTTRGFVVELFGHSASEDRGKLDVPRITITGLGYSPGGTGQDYGDSFELNPDNLTYSKYNQGTPLSNARYAIELWSNKNSQDHILEAVRQAALPNLSYIKKWDDPSVEYLIEYTFTSSIPDMVHGLIHKTYTYQVLDVMETLPNLVNTTTPIIKEITVQETNIEDRTVVDNTTGDKIIEIP